ncbi:MAG: hypothetical protein ACD_7C00419G0004 [uncultured bacterium]|nr:MAG: hypothetical protein ACD_7C00419G0004 [uncultured bacterium]HBR79329.1 hypothetical protein [Candidatus Moranbacteria bacterium]
MFDEKNTPPVLWERAKVVEGLIIDLQREIAEMQKICDHSFENVMGYDKTYAPRVDERGRGDDVIKHFHCTLCCLDKPIYHPFMQCWKCGGKMAPDHQELYGGDRVHIHKCKNCGHEYDTT